MTPRQEPEARACPDRISDDRAQSLVDIVLDELIEAFVPEEERPAIRRAEQR